MLLGVVVYLVVILYLVSDGFTYHAVEPLLLTVLVWNTVLLAMTVLVVVDSVRKVRRGLTAQLATGVFVVKLAAIPFFLVNFALMALIALAGMVTLMVGGAALVGAAWISIGLTYVAVLSTSVYGWASVLRLGRDGRIGTGLVMIYTMLLFVFAADTLVGILLFVHSRPRRKTIAAAQGAMGEPGRISTHPVPTVVNLVPEVPTTGARKQEKP
jgi:hypothetical protein